jgi:hypothetical protein
MLINTALSSIFFSHMGALIGLKCQLMALFEGMPAVDVGIFIFTVEA